MPGLEMQCLKPFPAAVLHWVLWVVMGLRWLSWAFVGLHWHTCR